MSDATAAEPVFFNPFEPGFTAWPYDQYRRLREQDPDLRIDRGQVFEAALREVAAGKHVWEGQRLLDRWEDQDASPLVDEFLRERTSRSLEHIFTILALALPKGRKVAAARTSRRVGRSSP